MSALIEGLWLVAGFHAIGLGPALLVRRWTELPWRYTCLLTLLATSVLSYLGFWIAFLAPAARLPVVGATLLASLALIPIAIPAKALAATLRRPAVWGPSLATVLLAAASLWPLLLAGPGVNDRFAWKLPSDNILPGIFAHRVVLGASTARPIPPLWPDGDRASERPPLQAAIVAIVGSVAPGIDANEYQELATFCQTQWLPSLFLLGVACGLGRRALTMVLGICACSGFFFVNDIYTWPKLLAAALMLGALAILLEPPAASPRATRVRTVVVAALATLSLLAHPGPLFSLLVVPLCWPLVRPLVRLPFTRAGIAGGVLAAVVLITPWLLYQTMLDPPTGRLLRVHLGNGDAAGTAWASIARANLERPLREHVRVRLTNLAEQLGNPLAVLWPASIADGQSQQFFRHGASLGVLLIGLVALAWRRGGAQGDDAIRRLAVWAGVALVVWSLIVFSPEQALIHHGSPVTTALLFFAGAYGLLSLPRIPRLLLMGAHGASFFVIWIVPMGSGAWRPEGSGTWPAVGFAVLAVGALGALAVSHDDEGKSTAALEPLTATRRTGRLLACTPESPRSSPPV